MDKIKILALFGKSGAGKDYLKNWMLDKYPVLTKGIVRLTTRKERYNEMNLVDYNFVSAEDFASKLLSGELIEAEQFNNWFYGTSFSSLDKNKINIGCYSINAIETLFGDDRLEIFPIYIKSLDRIRLLRSLNRDPLTDCSEICRRFLADEKDFKDGYHFPFTPYYCYYNDDFTDITIDKLDIVKNILNEVKLGDN